MTINTEVVVLGAGPGGYAAAFYAADRGKQVILVEQSKRLVVLTRTKMVDVLRQAGHANVERIDEVLGQQVARGTGQRLELACDLLFRSIGYKGIAMPGLPFDARQGVFPTRDGRILDDGGAAVPGLYASGWIKRGPTGIIGTNRADSVATVGSVLADLRLLDTGPKSGADGLSGLLAGSDRRVVSYADWLVIDRAEVERGAAKGKPREKFTRIGEMLALLGVPAP